MTISSTPYDQWQRIIPDYLTLAETCLGQARENGAIPHGYSAALLLLCAIDGIGHGLLPPASQACRLDVLCGPPCNLSSSQVKNLEQYFRHGLAHAGITAEGVLLTADTTGDAFDFDVSGQLVKIRLPVLAPMVRQIWESRDRSVFHSHLRSSTVAQASTIQHQPTFITAQTQAPSGCGPQVPIITDRPD
jgi:hypothetical protein